MGAEEARGRAALLTAAPRKHSQRDHRRYGRALRHRCGGRVARKAAPKAAWAAEAAPEVTAETALLTSEQPSSGAIVEVVAHQLPSGLEAEQSVPDIVEAAPALEAETAPVEANAASAGVATSDDSAIALCDAAEGSAVEVVPGTEQNGLADSRKERHVHFDDDESTWFHITPYAEVYGMHPRLFDFDKNYWMVPSLGCPNTSNMLARLDSTDDEDDDSSDTDLEEDWYEVLDDSLFDEPREQTEECAAAGGEASGAGR